MKKFIALVFAFAALAVISGCGPKDPPLPVSKETFINAYVEVASLGDKFQPDSTNKDPNFSICVDSTLKTFGLTQAQFQECIQRYNNTPDAWEPVLKEILKRLEEKRAASR